MPHATQPSHLRLLTAVAVAVAYFGHLSFAVDLTRITPTLTFLGELKAFTPPANCFSASVEYESHGLNDFESSGVFQTQYSTRWYVGCNVNDNGDLNTCCPPKYNTWGFYAPGVCPQGYTTRLGGVDPWIAEQRGTICCPAVRSPPSITLDDGIFTNGGGPVPVLPWDREPESITCYQSAESSTVSGTVYNQNWNARAIIVFDKDLPDISFEFQQVTGTGPNTQSAATTSPNSSSTEEAPSSETTPSNSDDPSPGSTSSTGPRQTNSESSTSSSDPSSTADAKNDGSGGSSGLGGGAIAGIAIGVSLPVIGIVAFLAYRLGKKRVADMPIVPNYNDPSNKEIGGIGSQGRSRWRFR